MEAASRVIANNLQRKGKTLFTNHPRGEPIRICGQPNDQQEAQYVVQIIKSFIREGTDTYRDFAVFYRINAQSRALEDQLRHHSIPYNLVGGLKFYERKEIKDVLGYMKLALNPTDDIAFKRIINSPSRGIGKNTIETLENFAQERNLDLLAACPSAVDQKIVYTTACKKLQDFYDMMEHLKGQIHEMKPSEFYHLVLNLTQYVHRLRIENTDESLTRIDNLEELNNAILQFENEADNEATLQNFLEKMSLVSDGDHGDKNTDAVTLMTLHVSKGLEYPNVFIVGMEEGLFPNGRAIEDNLVEEERRLAYVGMTRAEKRLFLTYAKIRQVWGQKRRHIPSRFIKEIPQKYIQWKNNPYQPSNFPQKNGGVSKRKFGPRHNPFSDFDRMPDYENNFGDGQNGYQKGMRIRHPKFGVGSIYQVEGQGEGLKISVMFTNRTKRKFVAKFTQLERL